jgi:hypothetical protein
MGICFDGTMLLIGSKIHRAHRNPNAILRKKTANLYFTSNPSLDAARARERGLSPWKDWGYRDPIPTVWPAVSNCKFYPWRCAGFFQFVSEVAGF